MAVHIWDALQFGCNLCPGLRCCYEQVSAEIFYKCLINVTCYSSWYWPFHLNVPSGAEAFFMATRLLQFWWFLTMLWGTDSWIILVVFTIALLVLAASFLFSSQSNRVFIFVLQWNCCINGDEVCRQYCQGTSYYLFIYMCVCKQCRSEGLSAFNFECQHTPLLTITKIAIKFWRPVSLWQCSWNFEGINLITVFFCSA